MSLDVYLEGPNARDYFETIARLARKPEAGVAATLDRIVALAEEVTSLEPPDNAHCLETCHPGRFECGLSTFLSSWISHRQVSKAEIGEAER